MSPPLKPVLIERQRQSIPPVQMLACPCCFLVEQVLPKLLQGRQRRQRLHYIALRVGAHCGQVLIFHCRSDGHPSADTSRPLSIVRTSVRPCWSESRVTSTLAEPRSISCVAHRAETIPPKFTRYGLNCHGMEFNRIAADAQRRLPVGCQAQTTRLSVAQYSPRRSRPR